MIGSVLKDIYRIHEKVGSGGFAKVYLGRNIRTNEVVAIKVLRQEYTEEPRFVERFEREARTVEELQHPNIVRMLDHGVEGEIHYLVMEYVEGKTVTEILQERGPLPAEEAVGIARQMCQALESAWRSKGIVHRDIKPHNVMVEPDGTVKIMDFGIALMPTESSLTQTGTFMGTPRYLSPEIVKGHGADIRSDLYAVGIVLYEMLTGHVPFAADSPWAVLRHQVETSPAPLRSQRRDIPEWLEVVVRKALAKDARDRFQTPGEMVSALNGAKVEPLPLRKTAPGSKPLAALHRHPFWPIVVGGAVALLIVGAVLALTIDPAPRPNSSATESAGGAGIASLSAMAMPTEIPSSMRTATPIPPTAAQTSTPLPPTAEIVEVTVVVTVFPSPTPQPVSTATRIPKPTVTAYPSPTATKTRKPTSPPIAPSETPDLMPTAVPASGSLTGRIAFSVLESGSDRYILYSISANGEGLRTLGEYLRQPSYRQDGEEIVANGQGGGMDDLWKVNPDGSGRSTAFGHLDDEHPIWVQSKSMYHVGFDSLRYGDGAWRIYLSDEPISYGSGAIRGRYPVALPGGQVAYGGCDYGFGTGSKCGLYRVSMWGGIPAQLSADPNDIPTGGGEAGVLFMRQVEANWDVYLVGASGGPPRRLTDHAARDGLATFGPDGRSIAFLSDRSGSWAIWLMGQDGSNQRKLFELPGGGGYGASWTSERISWGPLPTAPTPVPTEIGGNLLPAPKITFPIPEDEVSVRRPTTIRWSWSGTLEPDQGFEVRFWHTSDPSPKGVAAPTSDLELEVHFGYADAFLQHGPGTYYLEVVVVRRTTMEVLSRNARILVKADPDK